MVHNGLMCRACATSETAARACPDRLSAYLSQLHLFQDLEESKLDRLVESTRTRELSAGEWVFQRGDRSTQIYALRSGKIALFRLSADGRESIVAMVGSDEIFGEELIYNDDATRDLYARSVGRCTLLEIDRAEVRSLMAESVDLSHRLVETLHQRQQMLLDHIERLSLQDASGRLIDYLLAEIGQGGGYQRLQLPMPKNALAAHLAIQPETLSRAIGRLKSCGHVREENGTWVIDADGLRSGEGCEQFRRISWGCPGPSTALELAVS
jgi:CRP-like cAMP-binding protein